MTYPGERVGGTRNRTIGVLRHVFMHSSFGKATRERKHDEARLRAQVKIAAFVTADMA
jgi:hypothetical protein